MTNEEIYSALSRAIADFWQTRMQQKMARGQKGPERGERKAVTGGKHMDGFTQLLKRIICSAGIDESCVYVTSPPGLPGFYRPSKKWDLIVVKDRQLIAAIEVKSHIGPSFGNNFNNRVEEAIGNAIDLQKAIEAGTIGKTLAPFLGYLIVVEECISSTRPTKAKLPCFDIAPEFENASYIRRYELFCKKLVETGLYSAATLLTTDRTTGPDGKFREPHPELAFDVFVYKLTNHLNKLP